MIEWIKDPVHLSIVLGLLLSISELLALNYKIKSNSIFQLVVAGLKKILEKVKPKAEEPKPGE